MALRGTLTHWKTRLLANELGVSPAHALGLLEALWHVTAEVLRRVTSAVFRIRRSSCRCSRTSSQTGWCGQ